MYRVIVLILLIFGLALSSGRPASAGPEAETEAGNEETAEADENSDETFVKSLPGKSYTGDLDLEGWVNFGGGLVAPPIYVNLYKREDGTSLVLTSKLAAKTYVVVDARLISKPWKGYMISIACHKGDDFTLRYVGDARGPESAEWWSEVRRAWEIALEPEPDPAADEDAEAEADSEPKPEVKPEAAAAPLPDPGTIAKANTKGVKCLNPEW